MGQTHPLFVYFRPFLNACKYRRYKFEKKPKIVDGVFGTNPLSYGGTPKNELLWAVVVAQLIEQSLLIPEVRGSNPVIGKNVY